MTAAPPTAVPAFPPTVGAPPAPGLVSVWRYVEEVFEFHRGRLLLRGPNGSGKSMALELLLPFLLDADASPNRLTSAAKSRRGLFDRVMTGADEPSRTGYAWVEFRRGADTFTIGSRTRASQSTRKVDLDYFTTTQAVGRDLHLLDPQRVALSLKDLREAIGEHGRVHASADEHRTAVRETLYPEFGADRYASVVTALLALRKEKLSQNLDLDKLSEVLSEALPPIDDHDIAAVAEGFERLDRRRAQLEALASELRVVEALHARQRQYARTVLAWLADEVRVAESARDTITRRSREAAEQLDTERKRLTEHVAATAELDAAVADAATEIDALVRSDAYREGANLADLREQLDKLASAVTRAEGELERATDATAAADEQHDQATAQLTATTANLDQATADLRHTAAGVGAEGLVGDAAGVADEQGTTAEGETLVRAYTSSRRQAIGEVRRLLGAHRDATLQRDDRIQQVDADVARLDGAADGATIARSVLGHAIDRYAGDVREWAATCVTIGPERVLAALPSAADDPGQVAVATGGLRSDLGAEHAVARGRIEGSQADLDTALAGLEAERARFADGTLVEPDAPTWRDPRDGRPGAPLWRLVDIVPGTPSEQLDGVEAALVASGLADAWVQPDGTVDTSDGQADLTLTTAPAGTDTLASMLVALPGTPVDPSVVSRVLASVTLTGSVPPAHSDPAVTGVAIGADGTFRLGAAFGRGRRAPAALLGAEARERRRLARLAELDAAITANRASHREFAAQVESLDRRHIAANAELDAAPSGHEVSAAHRSLDRAEQQQAFAEAQLAASRDRQREAEDAVRATLRELTTLAARHDVPTDPEALDTLAEALQQLDEATRVWSARWNDRARAATLEIREREHRALAAERRQRAVVGRDDASRDHRQLAGTVAALASTVGAAYDDVLARLERLRSEHRQGDTRLRRLRDERPSIDQSIGSLEATVQSAEAEREQAEQARLASHQRFVAAVQRGLAADADVDAADDLDGVTAVLAAARGLAGALEGTPADQPARDRAAAQVQEQLHQTRQQLGGRVDVEAVPTDDGWSDLTALTGGVRRRVGDLTAALRSEFASATDELHAEEEQLFARVLAGDIRRALAERIRHANELVDQINTQLGQVRTRAANVGVLLGWDVDPEQPDAVRAARALLLRDPSDLTEAETTALQEFVRARVEQARAELETNAPWEARLRETLDYRSWHRFTIRIAHRDWEGYRPATPSRLQKLSTGERSIALHLPMLASIAAHYARHDGRPAECPRLILLDELFAGVDPANRAQLFARFTEWDLDGVFTSDHEWCQYATLDGIAIHHLHPPTADEPVTSTRFTWDGSQRRIDPGSTTAA